MLAQPPPRLTGALSSIPPAKSTRPRPLERRSTLKRSIDETNHMELPSSPSKRTRVTFDSDVEILSADEEDNLSVDVVTEQVRRAIQRHKAGDHASYDSILSTFTASAGRQAAPSPKAIRVHLTAMLTNIANLTKECSGLVNAVLYSEWVGMDDSYYTLFVRFLNNLAAAQRGYQTKIMQMLVDLLGPQKTRRLPDQKPVRQSKIHRRVMQAIQHLTRNVPSAPAALANRLASRLEFEFEKADDRMTYINNFMRMIDYVPELASEILANIMRELIKLDVCVQDGLDEIEDDLEEELLEHLSESQTLLARSSQTAVDDSADDDISTTDDFGSDIAAEDDPETARWRKVREDVKQVDLIMDVLFRYYTTLTTSSALETRHNAIERLLDQFHNFILPTYRSRHPQFLLFHFAQSDPIIVDRFVTDCVSVLVDKKQPTVIRHSAAAYFSGFVGRGAHVAPSVVNDCLELLCDQLTTLRKTYEPTCTRGPDLKRYGDFYAIFQAILYIFCFRWQDINSAASDLDDDDDDIFHPHKPVETYHFSHNLHDALHSAIYSPLNPLRVCTPVIVEQFAKLAFALQFLYLFSKLEENRHVRIATNWRSTSDMQISDPHRDMSWLGDNGMMEGYFPFDPYHLPLSKHWVESDYVEWKGIPGEEAEVDSEDDGGMALNEETDE